MNENLQVSAGPAWLIFSCLTMCASRSVYDGWLHPKLQPLGWDTVIRKGEVYNNCEHLQVGGALVTGAERHARFFAGTKATFSQK